MATLNNMAAPALEIGQITSDVTRKAEIIGAEIFDAISGASTRRLKDGGEYLIRIQVKARETIKSLSVGYDIRTHTGVQIYGFSTSVARIEEQIEADETKEFDFVLRPTFNNGSYFLNVGIAENLADASSPDHYNMMHFVGDSIVIEAVTHDLFPGLVNLRSEFSASRLINFK